MTYSYNPLASLGLDKSIPLDGAGKIPSDYLPSYVDDVVEYDDLASFPGTGETGKIYVAKDTGYTYRWTGSVYVRIGSGGEVALNLGSEGSPSLYFTGDTDTGIYSPGAGQVALSTNGTGRLFVDANGRVGVGSVSAEDLFEVSKNVDGGVGPILSLRNSTSLGGIDSGAEIRFNFRDTASGRYCVIGASNTQTFARDGYIYFKTNLGTNAPVERLRITSTGELKHLGGGSEGSPAVYFAGSAPSNSLYVEATTGHVGIGTSAPGAPLTTYTNSSNTDNTSAVCELRNLDSAPVAGTDNVNMLRLVTNTSNGYTAGLIGIGKYENSSSGRGEIKIKVAQTALSSSLAEFSFRGDGQFTAPGRVGIGTTSVAAKLQVSVDNDHTDQSNTLAVRGTSGSWAAHLGATSEGGAFVARGNVNTKGSLIFGATDGSYASYTERVRIDSAGRLLVGTSSALTNIYTGATATTPQIQISGAGLNESSLSLIRTGPTGATVFLNAGSSGNEAQSGSILGRFTFNGFDGTGYRTGGQIVCEVDGTPGANDMPGRLVFSVTADGASSPTEALRISNNRAITVSDGGNVVLGTTTGTKIGTATTQKLGFYNATPVVQPAAVADATDAATVITQLNDLLAKLRTLGIIAT